MIISLFVAGYYYNWALVFVFPFAVYFASLAVSALLKRKWHAKQIKNITLLLILCGILFSSFSYISRYATDLPTSEMAEGFTWMNNKNAYMVLSDPSRGTWINVIGNQTPIISSFSRNKNLQNEVNYLFASRNRSYAADFLNKNGITYIFIDNNMLSGLNWNSEEEGLLFIIKREDNFHLVFNNSFVRIYEYLPIVTPKLE